ncbi:MAG: O-antigen ligase family protein [Flavobacteriales bacterium]|jgi:O-antigen ligase|nr:O-antigen ligase family protein [Flavobacteriales bacterium]MBT6014214.1 O-antigen ligase family protein [Flavobacteriales bacterium]
MKSNRLLIILFTLFAGAMLAIGRFYDHRLEVYGVNLTIILSSIYSIILICIFLLIKKSELTFSKILQYSFFSIAILSNLVLWIFYDFNEYGLIKFLNFILITIPISVIISERFSRKDAKTLIWVLFGISFMLLSISLINISSLAENRSGVLGGGPIILSRWLCLGAIISFFHPKLKKYRIILFPLFIIVALFTGSRGPIASILITMTLYFFLNFRKLFWRFIVLLSLLISLVFITGFHNQLLEVKTVSRVFMNVQDGGGGKSTSGRTILFQTSIDEIIEYPLGVGFGNWEVYSKDRSTLSLKKLFYPHNLLLEILCEMGFVTSIIFILYVVFILLNTIIKLKNNVGLNILFYTFAFLLLNSMISGDLSDARLLFVVLSLLSIKEIRNVNNL